LSINVDLHERGVELHHHVVPLAIRHGPMASQLESTIPLVEQQPQMAVHQLDAHKVGL
jgi:hypothetical protein